MRYARLIAYTVLKAGTLDLSKSDVVYYSTFVNFTIVNCQLLFNFNLPVHRLSFIHSSSFAQNFRQTHRKAKEQSWTKRSINTAIRP